MTLREYHCVYMNLEDTLTIGAGFGCVLTISTWESYYKQNINFRGHKKFYRKKYNHCVTQLWEESHNLKSIQWSNQNYDRAILKWWKNWGVCDMKPMWVSVIGLHLLFFYMIIDEA
jgi:hypothetical protein